MVTKYQISNYEFGKTVERINGTTILSAKVAIPKLMTNMSMGLYNTKKVINQNLFINASDCRLKTPATVTCRGYCTLEKYSTEVINMSNKAVTGSTTYIPVGTKIMVEVLFEDTLNMHIIGKE
jgi:hypothetical protein